MRLKECFRLKNVYQKHHLKRGPRLVVIGGGTGLAVLLRGLKEYTSNLTAVVSVADDGGSSGRLRGQFGILPPGDLRNCLVALADTEPVMEKLFNYRFTKGELAGHNLGNLLIAAMADLSGSFEYAIREIGKVLAIRGRVIPSTLDHIVLAAELQDGSIIMGESSINRTPKPIKRVFAVPDNHVPVPEAVEAIMEADAVILGPGSLYTSVIPNLLVPGIAEAVRDAPGKKIYVCNIMTQPNETLQHKASDHLEAIFRHSFPNLVQYMIVNNKEIPLPLRERYAREGAGVVEIDMDVLGKLPVKVISDALSEEGDYIRHNPHKLARLIVRHILGLKQPAVFDDNVDRRRPWGPLDKITENFRGE
ncbi:MAG: YvcK family protein [Peptococcaceae bacterium]|jgi:uncharacterized cofD-like protein|nr:YvcK family protein [Peptococcaceae bacterium]MDH7524755.1 YvcK family protein [Peptococcaceae bacterium]